MTDAQLVLLMQQLTQMNKQLAEIVKLLVERRQASKS